MKKKKKRVFLKILVFLGITISVLLFSSYMYFFVITGNEKLNLDSLALTYEENNITILDKNNCEIDASNLLSQDRVKVEQLPNYVKGAFIATEDKRFYSHNGVDYKRMVGAVIKNIKSGSFSQGASTITQQLIKNTHLSQEKTLKRKLKEIKLAKKLEKQFSKDEILEMYLNSIYFGNGCYGLEKASKFYFDKKASELSIGQSALLAGIINAPTYFNPVSQKERSENRKKLVLKNMLNEGYITDEEYQKNANCVEKIEKTASKPQFAAIKSILSEVAEALNLSQNQLLKNGLKIHSFVDLSLANETEKAINFITSQNLNVNAGVIVIDNETKSVAAISSLGNVNLCSLKRQPGSTIKPIIVYSPALEEGLIYPDSLIVDEPINIQGYNPSNASKKYLGEVSVRTAVEKSLNVPAVKTMSNLSVRLAKSYGEKFGIEFDKADQNLALALGGMTKGVSLKELADAYSTLATEGKFAKSRLVDYVEDKDGKVLYQSSKVMSQAVSEETAYLMTDILKGVTTNGTGKRLKSLNLPLASKTGTVGVKGSKNNTDAYCVAYTPAHTVIAWIGADDGGMPSSLNGSNYPAEMVKIVFEGINCPSSDFEMPSGVNYYDIDTRSLQLGKFELASDSAMAKYKKSVLLSERHLPSVAEEQSTLLNVHMSEGKPHLSFFMQNNVSYKLYRKDEQGRLKLLCEKLGDNSELQFVDDLAKKNQIYEYYVQSRLDTAKSENISNVITIFSA